MERGEDEVSRPRRGCDIECGERKSREAARADRCVDVSDFLMLEGRSMAPHRQAVVRNSTPGPITGQRSDSGRANKFQLHYSSHIAELLLRAGGATASSVPISGIHIDALGISLKLAELET